MKFVQGELKDGEIEKGDADSRVFFFLVLVSQKAADDRSAGEGRPSIGSRRSHQKIHDPRRFPIRWSAVKRADGANYAHCSLEK